MNEYFGKHIRELRKKKNLTQEQFAEKLGVSFQSVSRWENCITYPDVEMIPAIARFFDVSTDYLFGVPDEAKSEKLKLLMMELKGLNESDCSRALEIMRSVFCEYDLRSTERTSVFGDLCIALYYSKVKKTTEITDELRKAAEIFFDSNPDAASKSNALYYFSTLEDENYISAFLDRYASDENSTRDSLLYERYLYRDDFDKVEIFRQRRVYKTVAELIDGMSWKDWRAPNDVNFALWKNTLCLDFLHGFTNETPTSEHPVSCGFPPDVFAEQRVILGELRGCYLAALGRKEEAITTLEDTVSLLEQSVKLPDGSIIPSRSPALPTLAFKVDHAGKSGYTGLYYADDPAHGTSEAWGFCPDVDYERLTTDRRWAWFDPLRDDARYTALCDSVKALISEKKRP